MPNPKRRHVHLHQMAPVVPRSKHRVGRQPGAVPILDLVESWGFDILDPDVMMAARRLRDRCSVNGTEPTVTELETIMARLLAERCPPAVRPKHAAHEPIVYFILGHERVKIGTTTNLTKRLAAMSQPPDVLAAWLPGDRKIEGVLHRRFASCRIPRTEWFHLTPELVDFIDEIRAGLNAGR